MNILKYILPILLLSVIISCKTTEKKISPGFVAGDNSTNIITANDTLKLTSIQWIDTLKDLGTIPAKGQIEVSFRFKNTGTKPLSINSVAASCGCTSPQKPSGLIQPNEESMVKALFNAEGQTNEIMKTITVVSNTNPADKQLHFTAKMIKP